MPLTTPHDLFVRDLSDATSAEQQILTLLPKLQGEALNHELQEAFATHEDETHQQLRNLEQVFSLIGEQPEATTCYAIKGIAHEHTAVHEQRPSPEVLELANLGAAARTEHYEMAMYTGLAQMARDLGHEAAAQLLQDNLDQEKAMAVRIEMLSRELGKQHAHAMAAASR